MPTDNPRITFTLSEDMRERIDEYRFSNRIKNQTKAIVDLINTGLQVVSDKALLFEESDVTLIETKRIPILGDTAAGEPIIANREYDEYIDVPIDGRRYDAAVRVTGDSMEPGYRIGDLALVRYQDDVEDGQIAVVCLDDEVTLKRVHHMRDGIMLVSDNPKYAPKIIMADDVPNIHLTGRAIGVIHWEE